MIKRLQITLLALFVSVWAMASETSVKNADGVEIWYDFDINTMTASVASSGSGADYSGNVVIPSKVTYEGKEYSVTKIGDWAFHARSSLTSITIPEGVTEIGYGAFSDCRSLTSITIPESVTSIGVCAFSYCSSLMSITIPEGVTEIGVAAFIDCYRLYEVYNKSNLTFTAGSSDNGYVAYYAKNVYTDESGESKLHTVGDYIFYVDEDNIELFVYLGDETAITLPSDYEGKNYKIGDNAFRNCSSLTSITIPEGVTEIGENAFSGCSSLTSITMPEGVTTIVGGAFSGCSSLTSITIPKSVTSIGNDAFSYCSSLTSITIPEGVTSIGDHAFVACGSLKSITIPEGVKSIGAEAFEGCYKLYEVYNKSNLTITAGSSENGGVAYYAKNVYTDESGESKLKTVGDYLFYVDEDNIELLEYLGDETAITLPSDYEGKNYKIGNSAFSGCSSLTSITIPESVTSIGERAFSGCSFLTSITIPESVTSIGERAFSFCSSLTSITIPESVTSIGENAFECCGSLTSITIQEGVTEIGEKAFCNCSSLTSVTIPKSVTSIGGGAFQGCSSLTSVTIPENVTEIGYDAFSGCSSLTSITIPEGVTEIGNSAFYDCSSLKSITIPEGVTEIGNSAFYGCYRLYEVYNKSNLTITAGSSENGYVAYYAKNVYTDESEESKLKTVGDYIFYVDEDNIELLVYLGDETDITLPSDYEGKNYKIGDDAFKDCRSLTSITIPESVKSIGERAFSGCRSLTSIMLPEGVTEIGDDAFNCCYSLTSITLPEGVTDIGDGAFGDCSSLTSITLPESVKEIGGYAFAHCSGLTNVTIGEGVTKIGNYAFYDCSNYDVYNRSKLYLTLGSEENGYVAYHANNVNNIYFETTDSYIFYVKEDDVELIKHIGGFDGADVMINEYVEDENIYSTDFSDGQSLIGWGGSATRTVVNEEMVLTNPEASDYWAVQFAYDHVEPFVAGRKYVISFKVKGSVAGTISAGLQNINGYTSAGEFGGIDVTTDWKEVRLTCTCTDGAATRLVFSVGTFVGDLYIDDFRFCSLFYKLSLPEKYKERVYDISRNAFEDDTYMTEIEIPEGVMAIGKDAMKGTALYEDESNWENGLLYVDGCLVAAKSSEVSELCVIEDGVRIIADNTFENITTLKNVIISADVRRIGNAAFNDCSGLTSITSMSTTPPEIGNKETFCNVDKSIPVYVLKQSVEAYKSAEYWKDFTNIVGKFLVVTATAENGTVTGAGVYEENEEVTLIATPDEGYTFVKWEDGETNATRKITVTEDVTLTAVFESNSSVTPISDVVADSVSIRLIGNSLIVEGAESYAVYALSGQCLGKVESLERGLYIVVADGVSKKIVVK